MAEKNNAYCTICGRPYHVCLSCLDSMRLSPWKIHTDTAEHFKISQIVHGVSTNIYTKDEARIKLKNVNLDDMDTFRPHIKQIIEDILKEKNPIVKAIEKVKPVKTEVIEVEPIEVDTTKAESNTIVENIEDIARPIVSRKRNYKVDAE